MLQEFCFYFRLSQKIVLSKKYATPKAQRTLSRWVRCMLSISMFNNRRFSLETCFFKWNISSWDADRFSTEPTPLPKSGVPSLETQDGYQCCEIAKWVTVLPVVNHNFLGVLLHLPSVLLVLLCLVGKLQCLRLEVAGLLVLFVLIGC